MELLYAILIDFVLMWVLRLVFQVHMGALIHLLITAGLAGLFRLIKQKKEKEAPKPEPAQVDYEDDAHYEITDDE